jgi:murein DD-endopeptidase MepM/ murein hydrolase activator NlpD
MTRLGWTILALIVVVVGGFASLLSFAPPRATTVAPATSAPPAPEPAAAVASDGLVVPVSGYPRTALVDSWGDERGGGTRGHEGIDIIAPSGTPVVAATAGRVEKLFQSGLGGTTLYQRSRDGRWVYYYAHLARYAEGIAEGASVRAGQTIAYVGDTGDAGPGNFHLHFAASRMGEGERWWQGEPVNPYPLLARAPASR